MYHFIKLHFIFFFRPDEGNQRTSETGGASRRHRRRQGRPLGDRRSGEGREGRSSRDELGERGPRREGRRSSSDHYISEPQITSPSAPLSSVQVEIVEEEQEGREGRNNRADGRGRGPRRESRRSSYDYLSEPESMSPSAPPTSLEVEVGGYASAPVSLLIPDDDQSLQERPSEVSDNRVDLQQSSVIPTSPPPSLELILPNSMHSWDSAAVIPRPSFNSRNSQLQTSPISSATSASPPVASRTTQDSVTSSNTSGNRGNRTRRNRDVRLGPANVGRGGGGGTERG
ncbi:hypothetical protein SK128_000267, partial [Halocaridina rubra]